jgi:hypothetical protein
MKNKQKEWHPATKPLQKCSRTFLHFAKMFAETEQFCKTNAKQTRNDIPTYNFKYKGIFVVPLLLTYNDVIAGDTKAWRDDSVLVQLVVDGIAHPLTRLPAPGNN